MAGYPLSKLDGEACRNRSPPTVAPGWGNRPAACGYLKDFRVQRFRLMVKRGHRCTGPKHQEKRSMDYFAGLDVSVKDTSVCIVDDTGKITREVRVASEPDALLAVLRNPAYRFKRIGLECRNGCSVRSLKPICR
jgi:hypothetical protein